MKKLEIKENMTINDFMEEVKRLYATYFPESTCNVTFRNVLGGYSIAISCYLAGDISENNYGYRENDMFYVMFDIDCRPDKSVDDEFGTREIVCYKKSFLTAPPTQYLAYGRRDLPFRKGTGDAKKILAKLDKFFNTLYNAVVEERDNSNIAKNYVDLVNKKIK